MADRDVTINVKTQAQVRELEKTKKKLSEINAEIKTNNNLSKEQLRALQKQRAELTQSVAKQEQAIESSKRQTKEQSKLAKAHELVGGAIAKLGAVVGTAAAAFEFSRRITQSVIDNLKELNKTVSQSQIEYDKLERSVTKATREKLAEDFKAQSEAIEEASKRVTEAFKKEREAAKRLADINSDLQDSRRELALAQIESGPGTDEEKAAAKANLAKSAIEAKANAELAALKRIEQESEKTLRIETEKADAERERLKSLEAQLATSKAILEEEKRFRQQQAEINTTVSQTGAGVDRDALREVLTNRARDASLRRIAEIRGGDSSERILPFDTLQRHIEAQSSIVAKTEEAVRTLQQQFLTVIQQQGLTREAITNRQSAALLGAQPRPIGVTPAAFRSSVGGVASDLSGLRSSIGRDKVFGGDAGKQVANELQIVEQKLRTPGGESDELIDVIGLVERIANAVDALGRDTASKVILDRLRTKVDQVEGLIKRQQSQAINGRQSP